MRNQVRKRENIELLKIVLDGNWYSSGYLKLAAGKFIPPEIASRVKDKGHLSSVERGRGVIIGNTLRSFCAHGRVERRRDSEGVEWRLKDIEWAKKMVQLCPQEGTISSPESSPPSAPSPVTPQPETSITLSLSTYNSLLEAKQAYESSKSGSIDWGAFLLLLLGFALGGKLIKEITHDGRGVTQTHHYARALPFPLDTRRPS